MLVLLMAAGCGTEYPQSTIDPTTDFGETIQSLYILVFWWSMGILAVVWALLAYVLIRFRDRGGDPPAKDLHGHLGLEVAWTIAPAIIVAAIAIPTIRAVFETQAPESADALEVEVVGSRFWWSFNYPEEGVITANELHLPAGRQVSLRLASADVVHSFWVPRLGGKRDVNPVVIMPSGEDPNYTFLRFTPSVEGTFLGQCAEFCGESHALMGIRVIVESQADFDAWVQDWHTLSGTAVPGGAAQALPADQAALVEEGRRIFHEQSTCILCHAIEGTTAMGGRDPASGAVSGPNLTLFGRRTSLAAGLLENTAENLIEWIRDPSAFKPAAGMPGVATAGIQRGVEYAPTNLTDEQLEALAAYLLSLR